MNIIAGPRKFVLTCAGQNNNKFWEIAAHDDDTVTATYGRVGAAKPQTKTWPGGIDLMEKRIAKKIKPNNKKYGKGNCYTEVEVVGGVTGSGTKTRGGKTVAKSALKSIAKDQITYSSPETADLIDWLADVNRHQIAEATKGAITYNVDSGLFQTPLGVLAPTSITQARALLVELGDCIVGGDVASDDYIGRLERYMRLIPTDIGVKRGWEKTFLVDLPSVQKQNAILDALDASYRTVVSQPTDDGEEKPQADAPKVFDVRLELAKDDATWKLLRKLFESSRNRQHYGVYDMRIHKIWTVQIGVEEQTWTVAEGRFGNVRDDLWHGTQAANLLSILKGGLVIPPSSSGHVTGRMFGDGVYASDQSTKALNYATSFWGGKDIGRYFMFHVKFAMGKIHKPSNSFGYHQAKPPSGFDSTFAVGGRSGVMNNEMIVYSTQQAMLLELVEFRRK